MSTIKRNPHHRRIAASQRATVTQRSLHARRIPARRRITPAQRVLLT
jgi:hypothetical protein